MPEAKTSDVNTTTTMSDKGKKPDAGSILPAGLYHSLDLASTLALVFGGCCANVWTYEELLRMNPHIGSALTFSQMLFIASQALPSFFVRESGGKSYGLAPRKVPLQRWLLQVLVLTSSSLLNNWVFKYQIPLTVQIVFRSAGLAVSMLFGWLVRGKKYPAGQVVSVLLVTAGVALSAFSKPSASSDAPTDPGQYLIGIIMLVTSLLLSGWLGTLQEQTYELYGPQWKEGVFYTHALSLPLFLFLIRDITRGFQGLPSPAETKSNLAYIPYAVLAANLVTQTLCVSGVNQLTSRVSSVSTNLALTVRKALSLCFSVYWFGSGWNNQFAAGAACVFGGSFLYALFNTRKTRGLGAEKQKTA